MTTPGPTLVYECTSCKNPFKRRTIASGNTFGARIRSDGRMFAPMLPTTPPIVACPHCNLAIKIFELEPIAEFRTYFPGSFFSKLNNEEQSEEEKNKEAMERKIAENYEDSPMYAAARAMQYFEILEKNKFDAKVEQGLRKQALWTYNDETYSYTVPSRFKDGIRTLESLDEKDSKSNIIPAQKNIQLLADSLDSFKEDELLFKAELLREQGKFKECCLLLDRDLSEGAIAEQIIRQAEQENSRVFLLAEKDDNYDLEYAWNARRYEPETISIPFDDLDPPLFKINNRNWFVKVLGMLSHNWALIEEKKDLTATVYFFQDEPPGNRPAVIDSLNFADENEAWDALNRNGFEVLKTSPGPWMGCEPKGYFYDARSLKSGIYSKEGYWK